MLSRLSRLNSLEAQVVSNDTNGLIGLLRIGAGHSRFRRVLGVLINAGWWRFKLQGHDTGVTDGAADGRDGLARGQHAVVIRESQTTESEWRGLSWTGESGVVVDESCRC